MARRLIANVYANPGENPMQHAPVNVNARKPVQTGGEIRADLCVIGAGSGGLSVAAGAVQMGASVVLVEKGRMGGDCLNTGCVPSKALIAAAHAAHAPRHGSPFGVQGIEPGVNFVRVHDHVHEVIAGIAPHDSVERFEGLGVRVIQAAARFVSRDAVEAGGFRIAARRFVIATGSTAAVPPIPGIGDVPFLTNESVFELQARPEHLVVIGGGPIGVELAQSFRRLGARVSVIEMGLILARDEPEAADVVRRALLAEGVELHERAAVKSVARASDGGVAVTIERDGAALAIGGSHVLVAAGRKASVGGLGLEAGGIAYTAKGVTVDAGLRTTNRRVYAIGDVAGGPQFTHIAGYHAGVVIRSALFGLPARVDYKALPWVTYADPELAHVGLTEADARKAGHQVTALMQPFSGNDRAQAERRTEGLAKIIVGKKGRILGATIVGPHAGEMISLWGLAIQNGLKISAVASMIAPYPTLSEISKRAAGSYYTPTLFSDRTRRFVRLVQRVLP
jgi:pyruvate/2-oxoglutarate dehydrogenase complex dihydrolipoamide dehydrogenase (E3) component